MYDLPRVLTYSYTSSLVKLQTEYLSACWSFLSSKREVNGWLLSTFATGVEGSQFWDLLPTSFLLEAAGGED